MLLIDARDMPRLLTGKNRVFRSIYAHNPSMLLIILYFTVHWFPTHNPSSWQEPLIIDSLTPLFHAFYIIYLVFSDYLLGVGLPEFYATVGQLPSSPL